MSMARSGARPDGPPQRGYRNAAAVAAAYRATYVHIATHGFFSVSRDAYNRRAALRRRRSTDEVGGAMADRQTCGRNPLAESGLALAGSALTAEELVGIDLSGTRLVVLSACETGRGRMVTGRASWDSRPA